MKFEVEVDVGAEVAVRVESLEKALTLMRTSREWNRKRVLELEDKLERTTGVQAEVDEDRSKLWETLIKIRGEREEAERKVRDLERRNSELVCQANAQEAQHAQVVADQRRSIEARDSLLKSATNRALAVTELLAAPRVEKARNEIVTSKGAVLADAISNALRVLNA